MKQNGFAPIFIMLSALVIILLALVTWFVLGTFVFPVEKNNWVKYGESANKPTLPSATNQQSVSTQPQAILSQDETTNWKTFQSQKFTFMYPSDWLIEDPKPYDQLARLTFIEGEGKYKFIIETGGRGGPTADNIENQPLMFQGFKFNRRTWINAGNPFFISFAPDEGGFESFNHVEISLPPENTDKYVKIFDQILSTFKFLTK